MSHRDPANAEPLHAAPTAQPPLPDAVQADAVRADLASDRRALLAGLGLLTAGALLTKRAEAGPLNPPAGAVAGTGKTLTEVEPRIAINSTNTPGSSATSSVFRITQPGSYYLTGNIISTQVNRHVIVVAASGVTIDLNGFTVRGLGNVQGAFDCIFAEASVDRISIQNGHIELAGRSGINLPQASYCSLEKITAKACIASGIVVGDNSSVFNCTAGANTGSGFSSGAVCSLIDCIAYSNSSTGFLIGDRCTVVNCLASENTLDGFTAGVACSLQSCIAVQNGGDGIQAGARSTLLNCLAEGNQDAGIDVADSCSVMRCCAFSNSGNGFSFSRGSKFDGCTSGSNALKGFNDLAAVGGGAMIANCSAFSNGTEGIYVTSDSMVMNNHCRSNGTSGSSAGIAAIGGDNRIDGNSCVENDTGISCTGAGNIVIRNTCATNTTNYVIAANNRYGPIINITASGTASANGNSAASTLASTDPHANFAY